MSIRTIAFGLLLLLPQLGFVWTDAKAEVILQVGSEEGFDER